MKEDKTPIVTARRRKATPHQRLRLEKAKELKKKGELVKKKTIIKEQNQAKDGQDAKSTPATTNAPKLKKDTISKPSKPPPRFRKRQVQKSWLPTHVWHAKRAHMTEPLDPLWRFAIPLSPTEKSYRPTHRAGSMRGCVVWDTSYVGTISAEGQKASLNGLLQSLGLGEDLFSGTYAEKWQNGTRSCECWIRERDEKQAWLAPVRIIWEVPNRNTDEQQKIEAKKGKRRLFIRVHPSAFLATWNEVLKAAKVQRPPVMIEDLRFEIGSIEITGPCSTEALIGVLHPYSEPNSQETRSPGTSVPEDPRSLTNENAQDIEDGPRADEQDLTTPRALFKPSEVFRRLASLSNPASLPQGAILHFEMSDPRLFHPPRTVHSDIEDANSLLFLLSEWPLDLHVEQSALLMRDNRLSASRLPSQKAISRRKSESDPGCYPTPLPTDPKIPLVLLASRPSRSKENSQIQGSWTVLLPWSCVLPVWYSLVHYPMSTEGNPRFGGLQESQEIAFDRETAWFPGDYPGTSAGWSWELREREHRRKGWERRPKGRRCEYSNLDLGEGRKGEIGIGWGCDWERLFDGPLKRNDQSVDPEDDQFEAAPASTLRPQSPKSAAQDQQSEGVAADVSTVLTPPLSINHIRHPFPSSVPATALAPVHIKLYTAGHIDRNARIYRLPQNNIDLRTRWLQILPWNTSEKTKSTNKKSSDLPPRKRHPLILNSKQSQIAISASPNDQQHDPASIKALNLANLAHSLLHPPSDFPPLPLNNPSNPNYPPVPDEEDLIGFVTSANYNLSLGHSSAIGNLAVARVLTDPVVQPAVQTLPMEKEKGQGLENVGGRMGTEASEEKKKGVPRSLCIVRNAGEKIGRLARWRWI